ncbi:MAG: polysaccharide deacetylase family protein [Lachnospiraceae bacterium]|nr:polysaccharide deacetylase family protein [Lachnospiraceae bacterium]
MVIWICVSTAILITVVVLLLLIPYIHQILTYNRANELLAHGEFDAAIAKYKALGDFKDSKVRVTEATYEEADSALFEKKYDRAIELFEEIKDYKDSGEKEKEACKEKAVTLLDAGDYQGARDAYQKAGLSGDADEFKETWYLEAGSINKDESRKLEALKIFDEIRNYKDAGEQADGITNAVISQSDDFTKAGDYGKAMELLENAANAMSDGELKEKFTNHVTEVKRAQGEALVKASDFDAAIAIFNEIGDTGRASQVLILKTSVTSGVDPSKPMVALSFDDGPSGYTDKILGLLKQYGGHATFCQVGQRIAGHESTEKNIIEQGSEIISHTWDHKQLTKLSEADIKKEITSVNDTLASLNLPTSKLYRPPYGSTNDTVLNVSKELGMVPILWSVDTRDWESKNAEAVFAEVKKSAKNGSIILCHDIYESTYQAMELVIPWLTSQGYQIVSVSELMAAGGITMEPGVKVFSR